ncbi:unnamed protein product [Polarella glacialis]|uniref:BRCA2 OB1 domain-containing protein n=2 Tax=Polarella glacialis TaxID=89957 RepID=A0A813KAB7_POLGL|nr:unnamed protein product [Polarella glacialis]
MLPSLGGHQDCGEAEVAGCHADAADLIRLLNADDSPSDSRLDTADMRLPADPSVAIRDEEPGKAAGFHGSVNLAGAFAHFQEISQAAFPAAAASGALVRFNSKWFQLQWRQLAVLAATGTPSASLCHALPRSVDPFDRLLRRCGAELAGRRSALRQICEGSGPAEQHMILLCSAVLCGSAPGSAGSVQDLAADKDIDAVAEAVAIELSDGWYFVQASLDTGLADLVRKGKLRAGRRVHICMAKMDGPPTGGCDPLELPGEARLQLVLSGCRPASGSTTSSKCDGGVAAADPASSRIRLGFQSRPFPPSRIAELREGAGFVPSVDVIVLRVLPPTFRSWQRQPAERSPKGKGKGNVKGRGEDPSEAGRRTPPEERSISQEQSRLEAIAEEEVKRTEAAMEGCDDNLQSDADGSGRLEVNRLQEQIQARVSARMFEESSRPQLQAVVLDAQAVVRTATSGNWWDSIALLTLPGPFDDQEPQAFDRLRITCSRTGAAREAGPGSSGSSGRWGPLRIYSGRGSRMQLSRPVTGTGPPGLSGLLPDGERLLRSPFCLGAPVLSEAVGPCGSIPPSSLRGHFCDLIGVPIHAGSVEQLPSLNGFRASCVLFLLAPGQRLCRVLLAEDVSLPGGPVAVSGTGQPGCTSGNEAWARLERVRALWSAEAGKSAAAAAGGRSPSAVAVHNVTFDWHDARRRTTNFRARRLQFRISLSPDDIRLRRALDWSFFSPAEVMQARASLQAGGLH